MQATEERHPTKHEQYAVVGEITWSGKGAKAVCSKGGCDWKAYRHGVPQARKSLAMHTLDKHAKLQ